MMKYLIFVLIILIVGCKQPELSEGGSKNRSQSYFMTICIEGVEYITTKFDNRVITPKLKQDGSISTCEE